MKLQLLHVQADKFRSQVAELKRKLDVLQSSHSPDAELANESKQDRDPSPPETETEAPLSPVLQAPKPNGVDKFTKAVLLIVKKKLDSEHKHGAAVYIY